MDAEAIVWLVFIAIWFISGVVRQIKQVSTQRPGQKDQPQPQRQHPAQAQREMRSEPEDRRSLDRPERPERPDDDPMVELLRKLGGEFEVQPQEPPRETRPEPARARTPMPSTQAASAAGSASGSRASASRDRSRPRPATKRPKVAEQAAIPEMVLPPLAAGEVASTGAGASALARSLRRDLRHTKSVRKAILLQEILGKPPGLQGLKG